MSQPDFLEKDEKFIDTWTINYIPPKEGRYVGKLYVTDKRLVFESIYDMSAVVGGLKKLATAAVVAEAMGFNRAYVKYEENLLSVTFPRTDVKEIGIKTSFFSHKVIVTVKDGTVHTFDYGVLSVKKLIEALKQAGYKVVD